MIVLVTDPRYAIDHLVCTIDLVHRALPEGTLVVQLRDKTSPPDVRQHAAERIRATGARLVLNGTPEDARRMGAAGVHLPGSAPDVAHARAVLGDEAWISIAAHDEAAVRLAVRGRATAALVSPIYETPGKGPPRGEDALVRARAIARHDTAIVALGGVDLRRAASCAAAGADGVAVIRAIFDAADPVSIALALEAPFSARRP